MAECKTSLAVEAAKGEEPTVYLFVSRKNEAALCQEFSQLISDALGIYVPKESGQNKIHSPICLRY
ncbi:MAG: hypothetical protein LUD17_06150 [Bacteroidales bacterium]|nr:hypothetical protein [Bacteroidales bacterium]